MNPRILRTLSTATLIAALASMAAADGRISQIDYCGPDDPNHPNVVQIVTETPFSVAGCDSTFAAIRVDAAHQAMIDFVKEAYVAGRPIKVVLNPNDKYYPAANAPNGRCVIARVSNY